MNKRIIIIVVVVSLGIGGWFYFSSQQDETSIKNEVAALNEADIYVQAQEFVRRGLKAPATAIFPPLAVRIDDLGGERYVVSSYVDSQNSFGALLRDDWTVVIKLSENLWVLERMVIGGSVIYDPVESEIEAEKARIERERARKKLQEETDALLKQIEEAQRLISPQP